MREKTVKGRLKRVGVYSLCGTTVACGLGAIVTFFVGLICGAVAQEKVDKAKDEILKVYSLDDQLVETQRGELEKIKIAYKDGVLTDKEYLNKLNHLTSKDYAVEMVSNKDDYKDYYTKLLKAEKANAIYTRLISFGTLGLGLFSGAGYVASLYIDKRDRGDFDDPYDYQKLLEKQTRKGKPLSIKPQEGKDLEL